MLKISLFLILCGFSFLAKGQVKAFSPDLSSYHLVWADEFNKDGQPDTSNWNFEHGFKRNHELQWYQPENVYCKSGYCVIEALRTTLANPDYLAGSNNWKLSRPNINYTSASMNTRGKQSWKYGRFIIRARIDIENGMWPAFWTLGDNKPWPLCGEIDIMEYYHDKLLANVIYGSNKPYKAVYNSSKKPISDFGAKWSQLFHIWQMDWEENGISLYVDGMLLKEVKMQDIINQDGSYFNPFMQSHYILLNLALGGDNGGNPELTEFPRKFIIDYVRVYQKNEP